VAAGRCPATIGMQILFMGDCMASYNLIRSESKSKSKSMTSPEGLVVQEVMKHTSDEWMHTRVCSLQPHGTFSLFFP